MFHIYTIHNILNNKMYVGKANDPAERWRDHQSAARRKNPRYTFYLHRAIIKYGVGAFVFSVIQSFDREQDCLLAEEYWISYFQANNANFGYNLTKGGEGASGRVVSPETRKKISASSIGRKHSPEVRKRIAKGHSGARNYLYGKSLSPVTRDKMSAARIGKYSGEKSPTAKLNWMQVSEMRELRAQGSSLKFLAEKFHVSTTTISDICNNKIWKENK